MVEDRRYDITELYDDFLLRFCCDDSDIKNYSLIDDFLLLIEYKDGTLGRYDYLLKTYKTLHMNADGESDCQMSEDIWRKEFARKLYRRCVFKGMSQRDLSYETDISEMTISKYMNAESTPSSFNLIKLSKALDCSTAYLSEFDLW